MTTDAPTSGSATAGPAAADPVTADAPVAGPTAPVIAGPTAAEPAIAGPATAASGQPPELAGRHRFEFEAIGTHWQIETPTPLDTATRTAVLARVEAFDAAYSRFRADSLVTALARGAAEVQFPPDAEELFALYDRLHAVSGGAVDPLVGRELELLGYDSAYTLRPREAPQGSPLLDARVRPSWPTTVTRTPAVPRTPTASGTRVADVTRVAAPAGPRVAAPAGTVIDVGAAGKGYLVDLVAALLRVRGHVDHIVDASGDLAHAGDHRIRVGLEHPLDPSKAIGVAEIADASLCASAGNRRAWGDGLHHIVDPRTGNPAREVIATWVVARTTALADGLATALFFTGAHRLATAFHFSYVRMYADGRAERSRDFPGELFV